MSSLQSAIPSYTKQHEVLLAPMSEEPLLKSGSKSQPKELKP